MYGYLNTQNSKCRALCIGALVVCTIGNVIQHFAIALSYMVVGHPTAPHLNEDDTPELAKSKSKATELNATVHNESISRPALLSVDKQGKYPVGGILMPPKSDDWQMSVAGMLSALPKVQGRPSTHRKG
jgi:hypothetical protein